jgi:hypothetical protein
MSGLPSVRRLLGLERRVKRLEDEIAELRRHHLRVAELADVITELVIPLSSRDQDRIDEAIEKFNQSL